jgi:hypothetical protein
MLTEYALTPHLFDDWHNAGDPQWLDRLRRFAERLLPANPKRACNTVVSDLCDGAWFSNEIVSLINELERRQDDDRSVRIPALDLLKTLRPRLERHLVKRPFSGSSLPSDEQGWADEAVASGKSSRMPIHRIVVSTSLGAGPEWTNLSAADGEGFWETTPVIESPRADLTEQLQLLRRMSTFYNFLAFASPQLIATGSGKDLTFAISLAKAAFQRPTGFDMPVRIDFHAQGEKDPEQQAKAILQRVHGELGPATNRIRLFLWSDLKERTLLFGKSDGSNKPPSIIWAVSATHVVRPDSDNPSRFRHTFSVLPRLDTSRLASDFYTNTAKRLYSGSPFRQT